MDILRMFEARFAYNFRTPRLGLILLVLIKKNSTKVPFSRSDQPNYLVSHFLPRPARQYKRTGHFTISVGACSNDILFSLSLLEGKKKVAPHQKRAIGSYIRNWQLHSELVATFGIGSYIWNWQLHSELENKKQGQVGQRCVLDCLDFH